jgi:hypothetical protein
VEWVEVIGYTAASLESLEETTALGFPGLRRFAFG